jgi:hypothetical protein
MKEFRRCGFGWIALVATLVLSACNSSGTSLAPVAKAPQMQSASVAVPAAPSPFPPGGIETAPGKIDGLDDQFKPHDGDTPSGGQGATVDGKVPCLPSMGNGYHIHVFLGIIYKGRYVAIPDTIGMVNPGPEVNGYVNTAQCFYEIHTHDASGIVHLEVARPIPLSNVVFKLKNVLDVWGMPHTPDGIGPFKGRIRVYVGMPPALGDVSVTSYQPFNGHWAIMGLHSHEVIWIEIGKPYYNAAELPHVTFYMEY